MESKKTVDIMPQDEENMRAVRERIIKGELATAEAISQAVNVLIFSSEEVKEYVRGNILALFEAGAYNSPIKGADIVAVDTDADAA
ncbi:MAG: hypothetical protein WC897_06075 [Candidatus Gracilibacteria bacterium]